MENKKSTKALSEINKSSSQAHQKINNHIPATTSQPKENTENKHLKEEEEAQKGHS
jgi:hypothetical protein